MAALYSTPAAAPDEGHRPQARAQSPEWRQYVEASSVENTYLNARDSRRMMDAEHASLSAMLAELGLAK